MDAAHEANEAKIDQVWDALGSGAGDPDWLESKLVWVEYREAKEGAMLREVGRLEEHAKVLQSVADQIAEEVAGAAAESDSAWEAINKVVAKQLGHQPATDLAKITLADVAQEILTEALFFLLGPAVIPLRVAKWAGRAWKGVKLAYRIARTTLGEGAPSAASVESAKTVQQLASRVREQLHDIRIEPARPQWPTVEGLLDELDSAPALGPLDSTPALGPLNSALAEDGAGVKSLDDLLRELERIQVSAHDPDSESTTGLQDRLLRELDRGAPGDEEGELISVKSTSKRSGQEPTCAGLGVGQLFDSVLEQVEAMLGPSSNQTSVFDGIWAELISRPVECKPWPSKVHNLVQGQMPVQGAPAPLLHLCPDKPVKTVPLLVTQ